MKKIGIYLIRNLSNNKIYVGSSNDMMRRWTAHKRLLMSNKHTNLYLQRSWNEYGQMNFEFLIAEECDQSVLVDKEQEWIRRYDSMNTSKGYNLMSADRQIISAQTKAKMSEVRIGMRLSEATKNKLSEVGKADWISRKLAGYSVSEETKRKISEAKTGVKRKPMKRRPMSAETKRKISEARLGKGILKFSETQEGILNN